MRCKVILVIGIALAASLGFAQDINRSKEWHIKRAEQPEAKVAQQMARNGTIAPVGQDPSVLDEEGNPIQGRGDQSGALGKTDDQATNTVRKQSDRLVSNEFDIAATVVDAPVKEKTSPALVGGVFLILGILLAATFRFATQKIKVPANI